MQARGQIEEGKPLGIGKVCVYPEETPGLVKRSDPSNKSNLKERENEPLKASFVRAGSISTSQPWSTNLENKFYTYINQTLT